MESPVARRMWLAVEPLHAVTYFAPESFAAWEAAGLRGFWRGYFATRAAPFGATGPAPIVATFYNFAPAMVERALPAAWAVASPAAALEARVEGATEALRRILGEAAESPSVRGVGTTVRRAVEGCSLPGRALFAANASISWPDDDLSALWHGLTCLREHRGDGHNAALVIADIDGCEAHVLASAVGAGGAPAGIRQASRGWTDDEWVAAEQRLALRGLVNGSTATARGRTLHSEVERRTDELALAPWAAIGEEATTSASQVLRSLAEMVITSGVLRFPNPMGLPPLEGGGS